jgi:hypothetical protein
MQGSGGAGLRIQESDGNRESTMSISTLPAPPAGTAAPADLAAFYLLATVGSRWRLDDGGPAWHGPRSGVCVVTSVAGPAERPLPRYRVVFDDGGTATRVRWDLPPADYLTFDGVTLTSGSRSWTYLGHLVGPVHQPPAREVSWCRVDRLLPGDITYGPDGFYSDRAPGYTVASVDLSASPALVSTEEGWPLRFAPWTLMAITPVAHPERCQPNERLPLAVDTPTTVYLGVNTVDWLRRPELADVPKCISRNRLAAYRGRRIPLATNRILFDSAGFTELQRHGRWRVTPEQFVAQVRAQVTAMGRDHVAGVAPMDWMCEDEIIDGGVTKDGTFAGTRTHLDPHRRRSLDEMVLLHQELTTDNLVTLRRLAPDLPIFPVLQGKTLEQYLRHECMYAAAGIRLLDEPIIGLGSVCRRQGTQEIATIVRRLAGLGARLHGFGVGAVGLSLYGQYLLSADSDAWSYHGRRAVGRCPHGLVVWEQNCPIRALDWWHAAGARLTGRPTTTAAAAFPQQLGLFDPAADRTTRTRAHRRGRAVDSAPGQLVLFTAPEQAR